MTNINTASGNSRHAPAQQFSPLLPAYHAQQRGTALLVAMVLIFMMTIMGMSSLRETSLERRMTSNAVQKSIAFQLAESTANQVSQTPATLDLATNGNGQPVLTFTEETDRGIEVEGYATFLGESIAIGHSLDNSGGFQVLSFEVRGESSHEEAQVTATVRQGIRRLVPAKPIE